MILGSHCSWSFLRPKKWWMKLLYWHYGCQKYDVQTQYNRFGVRCFDLRIRTNKRHDISIVHGKCEYDITIGELYKDINWLNERGDCYLRLIHEAKTAKQYNADSIKAFELVSAFIHNVFPNLKVIDGRNLYNNQKDIELPDMAIDEKHANVGKPKWLTSIYPKAYANYNTKKFIEQGTDKDILLVDFVNYK